MTGLDIVARTLPSLALIVGALLLLRHWAGRPRGATDVGVRVVTRAGIAKGSVVAVLAVGERRLLVGTSEQGVSLLTELDREPTTDPAEGESDPLPVAPSALSWTTERPRMASIDRLRRLTVRQPVPSPPRRPNRAHRRT